LSHSEFKEYAARSVGGFLRITLKVVAQSSHSKGTVVCIVHRVSLYNTPIIPRTSSRPLQRNGASDAIPPLAEVNDVVAAVAGTPFTTQCLGMDRKQKRCLAKPHVRIIKRGFDRIHREI
jgi:hypothetical protein